jgi:REP element-mobilizing transposase RayT
MSVHKPVTNPGIYFVTFTCYEWLPLIDLTKAYDLVYNWFDILISKGHTVTGYVIMPNHLHMLLYFAGGPQSLNTLVGNGKRFMAYDIVKRLEQQNEKALLVKLQVAVQAVDKSRGKKHEIWKDSFDVKQCRTEKFILQKLNYIHNNPCSGKWNLADNPIHYLHSSASFYISGKQAAYAVKDYRVYMSFELTEEQIIKPTSPPGNIL